MQSSRSTVHGVEREMGVWCFRERARESEGERNGVWCFRERWRRLGLGGFLRFGSEREAGRSGGRGRRVRVSKERVEARKD